MWHKSPAPINFLYPKFRAAVAKGASLALESDHAAISFSLMQDGVGRINFASAKTRGDRASKVEILLSAVDATADTAGSDRTLATETARFVVDAAAGRFRFEHDGHEVVASAPDAFGVSGPRSLALFEREKGTVVYGLGEKTQGLDKAGRSYQFYNLDVVADHPHHWGSDHYDPSYVSIPFYISKRNGRWFGVLLDNPHRTFIHSALMAEPGMNFNPSLGVRSPEECVFGLGAYNGELDLYILPGPTLADMVRRFARLTGVHELPPLWALGYHQCRWSYKSAAELQHVSDHLAEARIPCSALWMDIDYMDAFRVFTFRDDLFSPAQRASAFSAIKARGTRLVTIVDPGVKAEKGYRLYEQGLREKLFCLTEEGLPYVGIVWPGATVFPDFSLERTRTAWAREIAAWLDLGIDGIWNDMNDPSTGPIDMLDMRFQDGTATHDAYHNQYGDLMARATVEGFALHNPDKRPFVLTRSASTGSQRSCAVWTGDNASNEEHLAMSIPMSINLALSGVSFNGPDVGGFLHDASEDLLVTWTLAGALFPFLRNHSCAGTRRQEPYMYQPESVEVMRNAINTRAKLLPTIYNLFREHEAMGHAVMRPLSYEFEGSEFERIGDQYLLGAGILVAPFTNTKDKTREVVLPPGWWYDVRSAAWVEGGRSVTVPRDRTMIMYIRDGSILAACAGADHFPQPDLRNLEFHVFLHDHDEATTTYYEDDGETNARHRGGFNEYAIRAGVGGVQIKALTHGYAAGATAANVNFYGKAPANTAPMEAAWPFGKHATRGVRVALG